MVLATSSGQRAGWLPFVARAPTRCRACSLNRLVMSHEQRFVERLNAGEILIADGATATNYQQMGMAIGVAPEEWIFDQPEKVRGLHRAFIEAGSDIILTDTFGAASLGLGESRYAGGTTDLNTAAGALAREAASSRPAIVHVR